MKEEKCFACDKKTKRKKKSRHLETLGRVERDDGSATLIDAMKKKEDLSDQWLNSAAKRLKVMTSNVDAISHIIIALFIVMRRKVPRKLK